MAKKLLSLVLSAAMILGLSSVTAFAAENDAAYVLMDIPYSVFYEAVGAGFTDDLDAVSSATNKTGNYGKAGGTYHSETTASIGEDGTVTAVGGENGSQPQGVIWPVKVSSLSEAQALGGDVVTDDAHITVATVGRGQSSSTELYGYQTLVEQKDYSYYVLSEAPDYYLELAGGNFTAPAQSAQTRDSVEVNIQYGTNWGDIQLAPEITAEDSNLICNAVIITAVDQDGQETYRGLYALDQIWANNSIGWKVDVTDGLDGKTLKNIRYFFTVRDADNSDSEAPAYENYIVDYPVDQEVSKVYNGIAVASFDINGDVVIRNLPDDVENLKAKVYYTTGGRGAVPTYLTPLVVDPADDDIDPVFVPAKNFKVEISQEEVEVTNSKGESQKYGAPQTGTTYTVELSSDNYIIRKTAAVYTGEEADGVYALVNIPYSVFYAAEGVSFMDDVDAVSSATNKTGNYGKAGGVYHSGVTAEIAEDGTVTAVGGENGSQPQGVIFAVKADSIADIAALGGSRVDDDAHVTIATVGRGQSSYTELYGYETLVEMPAYSYYVLSEEPEFYLELEDGKLTGTADQESYQIGLTDVTVQYGTNWGDIQLTPSVDSTSPFLINAVVLTAEDAAGNETKVGLYALDQIWANNSLGWKVDVTEGLDGKTLTGIRYYCTVKDPNNADENSVPYENYIFDYEVNAPLSQVYTGEVKAEFNEDGNIVISNIPSDAEGGSAKVYYTTGGRNATVTYLTPLEVDPKDDDIDPVNAPVSADGIIAISSELVTVTNSKGESKTYGQPVDGTEYVVELSSDNYIFRKTSAEYTAPVSLGEPGTVVQLESGEWVYLGSDGQPDYTYTGIAPNDYGWWRIVNGKVDFAATGVFSNDYGWWYVDGGRVNFNYTGIKPNANGWWRIVNGRVDFTATGVFSNENGWWYVKGGKVDFGYTGIQNNANGWWRIVNGKVDFTANGVFNNANGWWYVKNGKVDFSYTGLADNANGTWYIVNGQVNFGYTGTYNGKTIVNGKVVS